VRIAVVLRVGDDDLEADFTGSDEQQPGNLNAVAAVTRSALYFALRTVIDPEIPVNGGCYRPVRLVAPLGTIVNALPPAAVGAGNVETSQRIADVCLGALAAALPGRVPAAGHGSMNNVLVGGRGFVYYETTGGGEGGGPQGPGASATQTAMTNTKNTPVEALEHEFPFRVVRYEIRRGSGGDGQHRGGDGIVKEIRFLEAVTVSLITERRRSAPWGLEGGGSGKPGANWLVRPDGSEEALPDKVTLDLEAGAAIRIETAGGGGWGKV
jgi:N-methylhydantoinase B